MEKKLNVLVVDDEEMIASLVGAIIKPTGLCNVTIFSDSREALEHYKKNMLSIDLVVLDMMMPHIGGYEFFKIIKGLNPVVPVVIMTGMCDTSELAEMQDIGVLSVFSKPFAVKDFETFFKNFAGSVCT